MANEFCEILIVDAPLKLAPFSGGNSEAGAVVEFLGVVRASEEGRRIAGIFYEAHREMARHQLGKISRGAQEKFGCGAVWLHHRVGFVPVAEPSLFVRVLARHRGPAFAACEWIIGQLKELAPIWKHPRFEGEDAS